MLHSCVLLLFHFYVCGRMHNARVIVILSLTCGKLKGTGTRQDYFVIPAQPRRLKIIILREKRDYNGRGYFVSNVPPQNHGE